MSSTASTSSRRIKRLRDGLDPTAIIVEGLKRCRRKPSRLTASSKGLLVEEPSIPTKRGPQLLSLLPKEIITHEIFPFCDTLSLLSLRASNKPYQEDVQSYLEETVIESLPLSAVSAVGSYATYYSKLDFGWTVDEIDEDYVWDFAFYITEQDIMEANAMRDPEEAPYDDITGTDNNLYSTISCSLRKLSVRTCMKAITEFLESMQPDSFPHLKESVFPLLLNASSVYRWEIYREITDMLAISTKVGFMFVTSDNQKVELFFDEFIYVD